MRKRKEELENREESWCKIGLHILKEDFLLHRAWAREWMEEKHPQDRKISANNWISGIFMVIVEILRVTVTLNRMKVISEKWPTIYQALK